MDILRTTSLFLEPTGRYVEAYLVHLDPGLIEEKVHRKWWSDAALKSQFVPEPIDRHWKWTGQSIEYDGLELGSEIIGILAGDEGDVQGAMMISVGPVPSALAPGRRALFVERLFTAPRNRRDLRRDGKNFLKAVGVELLTWGALMSRDMGYDGRLLLDASPDFVWWYEQKIHLQRIERQPIVFEGVEYTPMELPPTGAESLLKFWERA